MSQDDSKSTDRSDDDLERLRRLVLDQLPPGPARDRLEAMTLDELRHVDLQSEIWRKVREAAVDPGRHRLH